MKDEIKLGAYHVYEKKAFSIQILEILEKIEKEEVIILVRLWNQEDWMLSKREEIKISKIISIDKFSKIIHAKFPHVPIEELSACRIFSPYTFKRGDLPSESWYSLYQNRNVVENNPLYITTDGLIVIQVKSNKGNDKRRKR